MVNRILKSKKEQKKIVFDEYSILQKQNEHLNGTAYDVLQMPSPTLRIIYDENTKVCNIYLICECGEELAIIEAMGNGLVDADKLMDDVEGAKLMIDTLKLAQVMENPLDAFVYSCTECDAMYRAFLNKDIQVVMMLFTLSLSFMNTIESFIESDQ